MKKPTTLALIGAHHAELERHVYPGDGKEAVAFVLCGRRNGDRRQRLVSQSVHLVPYDACPVRTESRVTWGTDAIAAMLDRAASMGLSVIKVHSHPTGFRGFSDADDAADSQLLPSIFGWVEREIAHGSVVMLPDGSMFGRWQAPDGTLSPIDCISVAGDDLKFWFSEGATVAVPGFAASHAQAFDEGTIAAFQRLSFGVVGTSGTGSPTIEQFTRLGAGEIVAADDDFVELRNVNRILNSTVADANAKRLKVDVLGDAVERIGLGTRFIRQTKNLWDPEVIRAIAQCDILFGCMDTVDGRYLLNSIATHYNIPYFDIGVRLDAVRNEAGQGVIREVCGTINYLQPGRSSLISRDLFSMQDVAAAGLRRNDPNAHARQIKDGYIKGTQAHRPAVISVNMLASSLAVNELLARLHPYREEPNANFASVTFSLSSMEFITEPEGEVCNIFKRKVGAGDLSPLLGMPELSARKSA
jgi:hypothetical protein